MIGRALIRRGEFVARLEADGTRLRLTPAADWDVRGPADPDMWRYRLNLAGPSTWNTHHMAHASGVLHFMYSADPSRPWRGVAPIDSASLAAKLSAELSNMLAAEAAGPSGYVIPTPLDGQDSTIDSLLGDLRSLKGSTGLVEATDLGFNDGSTRNVSKGGWDSKRIGADPPAVLAELHKMATGEVLMACGVNPGLFSDSGTVSREAWRQVLHGLIAPLGELVASEVSAKLGRTVELSWAELRASDIMGRARALQSMTGAGATLESAAEHAGLGGLSAAPEPAPQPTPDSEGIG